MVPYSVLLNLSGAESRSEEGSHASPSGSVSSISCPRSHAVCRVIPRQVAISVQDRPALRAYFTVTSSVLSQVCRTCCIAFKVAAISAFQLCRLDIDAPVDRGPVMAR